MDRINILETLHKTRKKGNDKLLKILAEIDFLSDIANIINEYLEKVVTPEEALRMRNVLASSNKYAASVIYADHCIYLISILTSEPTLITENPIMDFDKIINIVGMIEKNSRSDHYNLLRNYMLSLDQAFLQLGMGYNMEMAQNNALWIGIPSNEKSKEYRIKIFMQYVKASDCDNFMIHSDNPVVHALLKEAVTLEELEKSYESKIFKGFPVDISPSFVFSSDTLPKYMKFCITLKS